jgi:DNA-directed RNA polymerase specialized sigma24 family protein
MQRTVIVLRFYEDSSVDETAAALGCSAGNVKRHTHDAIRRLSELIELDGEPTVGPAKKGSARDER